MSQVTPFTGAGLGLFAGRVRAAVGDVVSDEAHRDAQQLLLRQRVRIDRAQTEAGRTVETDQRQVTTTAT